ncbi:MAG: cobalamin-dependent protein, partial [Deltaproteobacteria bacterium]
GDIHHIGKNIVTAVLEGDGYEVHDLGEDVPPAAFLDKARELGYSVDPNFAASLQEKMVGVK